MSDLPPGAHATRSRQMAHEREQIVPEEVRFLGRLAAYGLLIGVIYWFVAYEVAGTVLLIAFGLAAGFATIVLLLDVRRRRRGPLPRRPADWLALTADERDPPFADEPATLPAGSGAPLEFGFGLAVAVLGLVFGAWLIALGMVPIVVGAATWIRAAMAEHRAITRTDPPAG
jgi:cytochrome c oxidase subunit IV